MLTENDIRRALTALNITRGPRDVSTYAAMAASWGAAGLEPLPNNASEEAIAERDALVASYPPCPSEAELVATLETLDIVSPEQLVAHAANKRWRVETGGITVGGLPIATDDRSKMMIMGARVKAGEVPEFTTQWKTSGGGFVTVDADTIVAISDAVLAHVDACFAAEAVVLGAIEAGDITTTEEIDAADWPG